MKPVALCLVHMGQKGLELVRTYPEVLPKEVLNEITIKSMPLGAKSGDFSSNVVSNDNAFSGYVFQVPSETGRDNIASLVAVFNKTDYNANLIRKVFSITINELQKNKQVKIDTISQILPGLYKGLEKGHIKVKMSSVVTIEIEINDDDQGKDPTVELVEDFTREIWK
jgi:DNA polymerase III alpha subunit (gram-positive type)